MIKFLHSNVRKIDVDVLILPLFIKINLLPILVHSRARLLPTTVPEESIAFLANFSSSFPASAAGYHNLIFDTVITNVGNAYHPHSGSFLHLDQDFTCLFGQLDCGETDIIQHSKW